MAAIRASVPDCPGDGNIDFVVNDADLDDWRFYANTSGLSSVYDLNLDGLVSLFDVAILTDYLGGNITQGDPPFIATLASADLNQDGAIDSTDLILLIVRVSTP